MKFAIATFVLCCIYSCKPIPANDRVEVNEPKNETRQKVASTAVECLGKDDYLIDAGNSVEYVNNDTAYDVKVRINNVDTLLGWSLLCDMPGGLVPELFFKEAGVFYLTRGLSNTFREMIVCTEQGEEIQIERFETALVSAGIHDGFVFKKQANEGTVFFIPRLLNDTINNRIKLVRTYRLPAEYGQEIIHTSEVWEDSIVVKFESGKQLTAKF